ncbi:uncharacterized protein LOC132715432 [Ruditapes philippinarum]|uniref:uncharacterized protein LOC132715432 n=1 Tax=Ruditapes philippinarum TaxID=129788 RepID=UPI00295B1CF0|nr:uncharacterized protein LOC132715432 [Ruditapes philippinarum]
MTNAFLCNIFHLFALGLSRCLVSSAQFNNFLNDGTFDGLTCPESGIVFNVLNIQSDIQCAFQCPRYDTCVAVFYKPSEKKCVGCLTTEGMTTEEGNIGYASGCGTPPPIAYGNITLTSGTNFMDTATVACDSRFRASSETITCTSDGVWETATCEEYDCYLTTPGEYKGKRNTTYMGTTCFRWDSPEATSFCETSYCPDPAEAENYCRNSDFDENSSPWCIPESVTQDFYKQSCEIHKCD